MKTLGVSETSAGLTQTQRHVTEDLSIRGTGVYDQF